MLSNHWKLSESAERETLASADEDYKDEDEMLASEEEGGKDVSGGENVAHSWRRDAEESNCNVFGGAIVTRNCEWKVQREKWDFIWKGTKGTTFWCVKKICKKYRWLDVIVCIRIVKFMNVPFCHPTIYKQLITHVRS